GVSGLIGFSGFSGVSGLIGVSGFPGVSGICGTPGVSGVSGLPSLTVGFSTQSLPVFARVSNTIVAATNVTAVRSGKVTTITVQFFSVNTSIILPSYFE